MKWNLKFKSWYDEYWKIFAITPKYCEDLDYKVWLEFVYVIRYNSHPTLDG